MSVYNYMRCMHTPLCIQRTSRALDPYTRGSARDLERNSLMWTYHITLDYRSASLLFDSRWLLCRKLLNKSKNILLVWYSMRRDLWAKEVHFSPNTISMGWGRKVAIKEKSLDHRSNFSVDNPDSMLGFQRDVERLSNSTRIRRKVHREKPTQSISKHTDCNKEILPFSGVN